MQKLDIPDLCARLDQMKRLCDRLEDSQDQPPKYQELVRKIQNEANELCDTVCGKPARRQPAKRKRAR